MAVDTTSGLNLRTSSRRQRHTSTPEDRDTSAATGNQSLGKDAFLQLLVTQMKNQNPLDPQDNGAFVAQLAQFSSLEGITTLNDSVRHLQQHGSSQPLQASSLVGRSIITQTDKALVDTSKSMTGRRGDCGNGQRVRQDHRCKRRCGAHHLGAQSAGTSSFIWDGKTDAGDVAPAGTYTFAATTKSDSGDSVALATSLPATVTSVTFSQTGEMVLNLAGGMGSVKLSQIQTIGI
jgi:flagellar basal-body rod modification protein FlgD